MTAKTDWHNGDELTPDVMNSLGFDINGKAPAVSANLTGPKVDIIRDVNAVASIVLPAATTPVNYIKVKNSAAGSSPSIESDGSDANIGLTFASKGGGAWLFYVPTGQQAQLIADGPDTNHNLNLRGKGAGTVRANGSDVVTSRAVPATASSTGTAGQIAWDIGFVYVCVATNTWKRAALVTW